MKLHVFSSKFRHGPNLTSYFEFNFTHLITPINLESITTIETKFLPDELRYHDFN